MRTVGTTSRGVRCPVVREGDDLVKIVTDAILACGEEQGLTFHDRDIVAVTEAVVARSQGNYAGVEDIAADCRAKFGADTVALTFPILSRNRIAICLNRHSIRHSSCAIRRNFCSSFPIRNLASFHFFYHKKRA